VLTEFYLVIVFLSPGPVIKSYVKSEPFTTQALCAEYAQHDLINDLDALSPPAGSMLNVDCIPLEQETI